MRIMEFCGTRVLGEGRLFTLDHEDLDNLRPEDVEVLAHIYVLEDDRLLVYDTDDCSLFVLETEDEMVEWAEENLPEGAETAPQELPDVVREIREEGQRNAQNFPFN